MISERESAASFLNLQTTLRELDLKGLPLERVEKDSVTYNQQLNLGRRLFEAVISWGSASPQYSYTVGAKTEQNVRNLIVKHTDWIIFFVGACVAEANPPMSLTKLRYGVELLLEKFKGMDQEFDARLRIVSESKEVYDLRQNSTDYPKGNDIHV